MRPRLTIFLFAWLAIAGDFLVHLPMAIAKTPPMATAVEATRVGIAKYLAPLIFVYNPSLLFVGPVWLTAVSAVLALAGLWVLTMVMEGWYRGTLDAGRRVLLLVASILLLYPPTHELLGIGGWSLSAIGAILAALVIVPRMLEARRIVQGVTQ